MLNGGSQIVDTILACDDPRPMRERILSEIKRLAAANGGRAPGLRTFENDTGIATSQWRGKLWARWGDAVADAGLVPNTSAEKLDPDAVLDCYEEACRRYLRPPTYAEWRIFVGNGEDRVGVNALKRVFGSTHGAVNTLRERAVKRGEDDLVAMLPETATSAQLPNSEPLTDTLEGWVYLLQSGEYFKIGRSDELERRVKQISIALPEKVELVHAIRTDDPTGIEAYWHRRFGDKRANGEWFKLERDDVKAFKRRKFQ
ncbi:MAG TPA: GIY-YIG nuclease family protein [Polyangiaceae bacterium]|nr:GIY-YIG nuclease family protein [Polyangiaceae bacterium]